MWLRSRPRIASIGSASRCASNRLLFPGDLRIAVIGSGSFSLEVFGPRIAPGLSFGVPDPEWAARVHAHMRDGSIAALLLEATAEQMEAAGNVAGELLDWIATLGTIGEDRAATWIKAQAKLGHSYGVWREDAA